MKHSTVEQDVRCCCFTGKVLSLPLLPLGDLPLAKMAWRKNYLSSGPPPSLS